MSKKLQAATDEAAYHMGRIQSLFKPGAKITVIVRSTFHRVEGDTDFVMTDDDLDSAIGVLERRKTQGNEFKP